MGRGLQVHAALAVILVVFLVGLILVVAPLVALVQAVGFAIIHIPPVLVLLMVKVALQLADYQQQTAPA
ncbi:MAG: hypothetical protein HYS80_00205 [Candidatus Aenigmarchaeota archaeon]|nr:hypothetical protein [Candidatus Aenigmarchaeota archaeon]